MDLENIQSLNLLIYNLQIKLRSSLQKKICNLHYAVPFLQCIRGRAYVTVIIIIKRLPTKITARMAIIIKNGITNYILQLP